jgi:hypothetical protein
MGMFDTVIVLDEALHCPHDHRLSGFQTKGSSRNNYADLAADASRLACVARRLHTPDMRAPCALPAGRLDAHIRYLFLGEP